MRPRSLPVPALLLAAVLTGCGDDPPAPAAPVAEPTLAIADPTPSGGPTASPAPVVPGALRIGQLYTFQDGTMTTTVLRYKHPAVPGSEVRQAIEDKVVPKGGTLAALEIRTCVLANADKGEAVSAAAWSVEWPDGTAAADHWSGFVTPEYPLGGQGRTVKPGRCLKGWITFALPTTSRPALAVYEGAGNKGEPAEWALG